MRYIRVYTAWLLYWAGDLVSRIVTGFGVGYPLYNKLMTLSDRVQGEGEGPWQKP